MEIKCNMDVLGSVSWLWKRDMDSEPKELALDPGRIMQTQANHSATLTIKGIQFQDNGIYFCQLKCRDAPPESGCGTELRVLGGCGDCPPAWGTGEVNGATGSHPHPTPACHQ